MDEYSITPTLTIYFLACAASIVAGEAAALTLSKKRYGYLYITVFFLCTAPATVISQLFLYPHNGTLSGTGSLFTGGSALIGTVGAALIYATATWLTHDKKKGTFAALLSFIILSTMHYTYISNFFSPSLS
ncbi:hypothetical protein [Pantoea agglomerans]|uniref:Uncharacterized protein n=1 Tax=Enterobacter agglomerans TaxID=549 RepID=A0ACC5RSE3_ENTAG|nr:hypothetical protein [Pantoea agglomerans]MBK4727600.1 hypothetical protein [Pantoea agglomerans]